jgi:uncharacterized protein (DUF2252 family)
VFSLNNFDETHPGPFEWDVKRLAASFAVASRDRGFDERRRRRIITEVVHSYRTAMASFAAMWNFDVWYASLTVDDIVEQYGSQVSESRRVQFAKDITKARAKDGLHVTIGFRVGFIRTRR